MGSRRARLDARRRRVVCGRRRTGESRERAGLGYQMGSLRAGNPLQVAVLWGDRTKGSDDAMLLKMPAGFEAGRHTHSADYHGLAVQGTWVHTNEDAKPVELPPGSYAMQP